MLSSDLSPVSLPILVRLPCISEKDEGGESVLAKSGMLMRSFGPGQRPMVRNRLRDGFCGVVMVLGKYSEDTFVLSLFFLLRREAD